ncbi:hypothetical protein AeMF1_014040 [Aphanomyces euteiches]|nr:hypothetical protein AeMF1_014040 [Aphanomyces euteiches]
MQTKGHPPTRRKLLITAKRIRKRLGKSKLSRHWVRRFLEQNPALLTRTSQTINRAHNSVTSDDINLFYDSLSSIIKKYQLDATRVFNIDETAFDSRNKSQKVLALGGSKAIWSKTVSASFHLSLIVCGSASGSVLPPVFIFPGSELYRDLENCDAINGSAVTTSNKGFITEELFFNWIDWFSAHVGGVKCPILLVMDNYGSHLSMRCFKKCERLQVKILFLPENATHLVQPLDICVFAPFKRAIREGISDYMIEDDEVSTIPRPAALEIASKVWWLHLSSSNMMSGFAEAGIWPLSREQMHARLSRYACGGVPATFDMPDWLAVQESIRRTILTVPDASKWPPKRKKIRVGGRILDLTLLGELTSSKRPKKSVNSKTRDVHGSDQASLEMKIMETVDV